MTARRGTGGGGREGTGGRSTAVFASALGLAAAVWLALALAPEPGTETDPASSLRPVDVRGRFGALPRFRASSWYLPDGPTFGFVEIAGGPFTMGGDPGVDPMTFDIEWWGEGRVQGRLDVPTFHLARFEVTVAQYASFVAETGHPLRDREALSGPPDHPVTRVSWTDAVRYARWLDQALRDRDDLPGSLRTLLDGGWRIALPTEAQWEKAARGDDGRIFPWGDEPRPDRARFGAREPSPVGSFACPECPYPVSDMSGNVWEWTRSPYRPYPFTDAMRVEPAGDAIMVMRGGSFADGPRHIRASNRGGAEPGARTPFIGFRLALVRD